MAGGTNGQRAVDRARRYEKSAVAIGAVPWIGSGEFENQKVVLDHGLSGKEVGGYGSRNRVAGAACERCA